MRNYKRVLLGVASAAVIGLTAAPAQAVIIGAPGDLGSGNSFPFGRGGWGTEYQQVYAASDFSGPMTITDLRFYNTQFNSGGTLNSGTFNISLSTTTAPVNGLNTASLAANIGADNTAFFTGSIPASVTFGSFFDIFVDISPFTYNPVNGNLLIDVQSPNASGGNTFLDAHNGTFGTLSSRAYSTDPSGNFSPMWGLVTGFNEAAPRAVPEPATLTLLGLGLAGLWFARRRKSA